MKYIGSKHRLAKHLLPFILPYRKGGDSQLWVEPFAGGCGMLDKVKGRRWANDENPYLIRLLARVSEGWEPPRSATREMYAAAKDYPDSMAPEMVGFLLLLCSYGGKWRAGFAVDGKTNRNYANEGANGLLKQAPLIAGVRFTSGDYRDMIIEEPSVIYCDPPYKGTLGYQRSGFDNDLFYEWCVEQVAEGHEVFISEYYTPFRLLFEMPRKRRGPDDWQTDIERLYKVQ